MCVVITLIKYFERGRDYLTGTTTKLYYYSHSSKKKTRTTKKFSCREINNEKVIFFQK